MYCQLLIFLKVSNFVDELTTVLETLIYCLQRFYLLREEKCANYGQSLVPVPVTESGTGTGLYWCSGSGTGAKFSSGRVLVCTTLSFPELIIQKVSKFIHDEISDDVCKPKANARTISAILQNKNMTREMCYSL